LFLKGTVVTLSAARFTSDQCFQTPAKLESIPTARRLRRISARSATSDDLIQGLRILQSRDNKRFKPPIQLIRNALYGA
jgi:hypothetical protein